MFNCDFPYNLSQDSVVLIFPGAAGPDSSTKLLKERIEGSDKKNGTYMS